MSSSQTKTLDIFETFVSCCLYGGRPLVRSNAILTVQPCLANGRLSFGREAQNRKTFQLFALRAIARPSSAEKRRTAEPLRAEKRYKNIFKLQSVLDIHYQFLSVRNSKIVPTKREKV